jgi:hypothetical protein
MRGATNQSRNKVHRSLCLMLAIISGLAADAVAQNAAARPDRGIRPVGSYSVSDIESVSLSNGNVHLSIPLASLPPLAGGKLGVTLSASYNSKLWDFKRKERASNVMGSPNFVQDNPQLSDNGGWRIGGTYSLDFRDSREDFDWLAPSCAPGPGCEGGDIEYCLLTRNFFKKAVLTTPDGSTHELRPVDYSPYQMLHEFLWGYYKDLPDSLCSGNPCDPTCTTGVMRYYSFDGSFIWAKCYPHDSEVRWEIYLPDGTHIVQRNNGQKIYDRTGLNVIRIYSEIPDAGHPNWTITHFVDQVVGQAGNREIRHIYDGTGEHVQYQTVGGNWITIDIVWGVTTVSGKTYAVQDQAINGNLCSIQQPLGQNIDVIRSIVLPVTEPGQQQGRSFSFSYNSDMTETYNQSWQFECGGDMFPLTMASIGWGSLSSMITPAGAVMSYTYDMDHKHRLHPTQGGESPENQDLPRDSITHKTATHDGAVDSWDYAIGFTGGIVTAHVAGQPDETTIENCYNHDPGYGSLFGIVDGLGGLSFRTNHSGKEIVDRHWSLKKFYGANDRMPGTLIHPPFNPVVDAEYTTLVDPNNSANNKMSAKVYQYDYNGNMTSETDYDLCNANDPNLLRDSDGVPTQVPPGVAVLRTVTTSYYNPAPVGSDPSPGSPNVYAKRLLADATPRILNAAQETISGASDTRFSYDSGTWPSPPNNGGNLTKEERHDDRASKWLATTHLYDSYGNLISTTDPKLNLTTIGYDANTHAQPTSVTVDPLNGTGSQTTHTTYDFSTGLVIDQIDANGQTTHLYYTNQRLGSVDPCTGGRDW